MEHKPNEARPESRNPANDSEEEWAQHQRETGKPHSMGHTFGEFEFRCIRCDIRYRDHQADPKPCPRKKV